MKVKLICVGKLKEAYWRDAQAEYRKRLGRFFDLELIELADEKLPESGRDAEERQALEREGGRILERINPRDRVIALAIEGRTLDSPGFARLLCGELAADGALIFVIGGSLGLSPAVKARANALLSFSPMTFPHQLFRILLLEQLYRACKINANESYHK